ncbi:MAG: hypothetical protein HRT69_16730 [Flavobacteriaceae bacterium]|nr:hypothetical protein [Flavobacteriaceae bacterium]
MLGFEINRTTNSNFFQIGSLVISKKVKKVTIQESAVFEKLEQNKIMQRFEEKRLSTDEETYLLKTELDEIKKGASQPEIDLVLEKAEKMMKKSKLKLDMLLKEHGLNIQ